VNSNVGSSTAASAVNQASSPRANRSSVIGSAPPLGARVPGPRMLMDPMETPRVTDPSWFGPRAAGTDP
jgi:hypothetical protein